MRPSRLRTWSVLAAAVVVVGLGIGGGPQAGVPRNSAQRATTSAGQAAASGTLEAILRPEADRVETSLTRGGSTWAARLLLLLAAPLTGLALLLRRTPPRPTGPVAGRPALAQLRRWVGLRAPPSSLLVALTP